MKQWINGARTVLVRKWQDGAQDDVMEVMFRSSTDHAWGPPMTVNAELAASTGRAASSAGLGWGYRVCDCGHDQRQHAGYGRLSPIYRQRCLVADCDCSDFREPGENPEADDDAT